MTLSIRACAAAAITAVVASLSLFAVPTAQAATTATVRAPLSPPPCGVFAAHRGVHTRWTENSLRSLIDAVATGADYVDIDVRETQDSQLVLMHDATVDRTTRGTGAVARSTLAQLQRIKLDDGMPVTTLHQDLAAIHASKMQVMLEVKAMATPLAFLRLRDEIRTFGAARVIITSFSPTLLTRLGSAVPGVRRSLLTSAQRPQTDFVLFGSVSPQYTLVADAWAVAVRQAGYPLYAWTANSATDWSTLRGKVDVVSTDLPQQYAAWRKAACPSSTPR